MRAVCLAGLLLAIGCGRAGLALEAGADSLRPVSDTGADGPQVVPLDAGLDGGSGPGVNPLRACPSKGCSSEENQPYADCLLDRCDLSYQACLGSGYRAGVYGGPCQSWFACTARCGCGDTTCRSACGLPGAACQDCFFDLANCVASSGCVAPVCTGTGGSGGSTGTGGATGTGGSSGGTGGAGGGGGNCADLMKCCAAILDDTQRMQCNQAHQAAQAAGPQGAQACNSFLMIYRAGRACP